MRKNKSILILLLILCTTILISCGNDDTQTPTRTGRDYFMMETEERQLTTPELSSEWQLLGMQFYEDEVLQFWGQKKVNEQLQGSWDVHLYREDGSSEFLFGDVPTKYRSGWYMDNEDNYFILLGDTIIKLDEKGNELYSRTYDRTFVNLYQDEDEKWMLVGKATEGVIKVFELNTDTGEIADKGGIALEEGGMQYITGQPEGLFMLDREGAWKLNMTDDSKECILSFQEMGYTLSVMPIDFRVKGEGRVEILQSGKVITLERVNLGETKEIVILGDYGFSDWEQEYANKFNAENETYYVVLEDAFEKYGPGNLAVYNEQLRLELAAGKGPDILFLTKMDWSALRDKGVFERLNPYMEQSGIKEEDYFPATFDELRDGEDVYTISPQIRATGMWVDETVLGSREVPSIEELLDALQAYEEPAVFSQYVDSKKILNELLEASDSLLGIVDWENGTCDFEGEFFKKMLQVAKRYGYDEKNALPEVSGWMSVKDFYHHDYLAERQEAGQVAIGHFFDDGCYMASVAPEAMAINSNSSVKEGAWEFIRYLLQGEFQEGISDAFPAAKSAFEAQVQKEIEEGSIVRYINDAGKSGQRIKAGYDEYASFEEAVNDYDNYRATHDLTEERAGEIRELLENARALPVRTQPILTIISEEAGAYFTDDKSIDEVCKLIQNRVQLYLDEQN